MKGYRVRPVWPGIALFALVMVPNILWEIVLSGDLLHQPSATPGLDTVMAVCQWFFAAALCLVETGKARTFMEASGCDIGAGAALALYWGCWMLYFGGTAARPVLLGLTVFPCASFLLFAAGRRNWIAFVPGCCFTALHLCRFWGNYM